jgi:hypothetical protein
MERLKATRLADAGDIQDSEASRLAFVEPSTNFWRPKKARSPSAASTSSTVAGALFGEGPGPEAA